MVSENLNLCISDQKINRRANTKPTKEDYNKWFLSLYPTKVRLKTISRRYHYNKFISKNYNRLIIIYIMIASYFNVTKLNSMKFLQNSSNMNLKITKYSHNLRWYNITLQEKGFHHTNNVLEISNINSSIKHRLAHMGDELLAYCISFAALNRHI
ncbi:hypothetical protein H8356DRAFT_1428954 [Neocallimastix lanati (nom. inval.)]|nr:hypothetical protein H8356DRAFT_1428954 [Neocallimastix sp. JGI-2020a]